VTWTKENELTAKVWVPFDAAPVSAVLSRVVGAVEVGDVSILEPNTDDIVREIYKAGSAASPAETRGTDGASGNAGGGSTGGDGENHASEAKSGEDADREPVTAQGAGKHG
jgi:ABC-2 type transport system ATP-binding protein